MNLKTIIFIFFSFVLLATLATGQTNPYNKLDKLKVNDLIAQKLEVQSTTKGAIPCPSMTQTQRNAIPTPLEGSCVFNQDSNTLNVYDGSGWVEVGAGGAGGGINNWETAHFYDIGDVVIESTKIYQCNTAHTSSVFATDIANWTKLVAPISLTTEVSGVLPMANGGSEKALTPVLGGVVYTDGGSMEVLSAGTSGQFLKSNGAAAPEWMTLSVDDATFSGVLSLGKGGTNKSLTASNGAIAYSDADSIELLAPGTSGQVLQSNGVAAPSYVNKSISAKAENASSVTLEEIQVSNNQLTQTDANKQKIETGNKNILVNPSFEHSTFSTGWTSGAGSFSQNLTVEIDGLKAAEVTLSAQALAVTQDSTLYAAQFADGVQGLVSVRVKTSLTGIKVCSRQAGVTSTTNCVNVQGNGKWGLYKVPMILGATSNGISIHSSGTSLTGTVYLDDAFVGAVDLQATVDASKIAGASYFTGSANPAVSTEAVFSNAGVNAPTVAFSNLGQWDTTDSNAIQQTVNNLPAGCYRAEFTHHVGHTNTAGVFYNTCITENGTESSCTNAARSYSSQPSNGSNNTRTIRDICFAQQGNRTFALRGAAASGTIFATLTTATVGFSLYYFNSSNTYSSTNADTDWVSCGHTTASFTGFGTVSAIETQCKRQGGDLLIKGKFTAGTSTAVEARISLPLWSGTQLSSAGSSIIPSVQLSGDVVRTNFATTYFRSNTLIEPSVSYLTFGSQTSTTGAITKAVGTFIGSSEPISITARIPIAGWQQSNIIIGQFNGLESCTNTLECTDTFSASISSTGIVANENTDWINGNCSASSGSYTCNFVSNVFTVTPNCTATAGGGSAAGIIARFSTQTNSQYIINLRTDAGVIATESFNIICQKQGVDYVGKTAKAVASDQNVRSIGSVGVDIQSVFFGSGAVCGAVCSTSPCTICNQIGSKITSVTRAGTGRYQINGIDGLKYNCSGSSTTTIYAGLVHIRNNSTSSFAELQTGNAAGTNADGGNNSVICIGIP